MSGPVTTPHVPVIPAVPSSELSTGNGGVISGADQHGAISKSGAAVNNSDPSHSNQDVTSPSRVNSSSKNEDQGKQEISNSSSHESKENDSESARHNEQAKFTRNLKGGNLVS